VNDGESLLTQYVIAKESHRIETKSGHKDERQALPHQQLLLSLYPLNRVLYSPFLARPAAVFKSLLPACQAL
jgi:hypothetical protein